MPVKKKIQALEKKIMKDKAKLTKLRRKAKKEKIDDYEIKMGAKKVKLSTLFGEKNEMLLVHNMGFGCPYCTLWADGLNGLVKPLEDRAAFVVENEETPTAQKKFAQSRGWKFKMASTAGTSLKKDLGFQNQDGNEPGVSALIKDKKGKIFRVSHSSFGPGDNFCVMWDLCDLLPPSSWEPKFRYDASTRKKK